MQPLAENLWLLRFPLRVLGCKIGRNVTIARLSSGKLVIHSTARFSEDDAAAITELGTPGWLVEATLLHDTFAMAGRAAFPGIPYLAPPGFRPALGTHPLLPPPAEWSGELDVLPLDGIPKLREHLLYHRPSGTLVAADFLFNLEGAGLWTRSVLRLATGLQPRPSMSRFFRHLVKDRPAFQASLNRLRSLDIQRIVVGHGNPIEQDARNTLDEILGMHGF